MAPVVTISATYGAAGSVIGPAVAERLGVPFLDRAIPEEVAERLGCPLAEALEYDDRAPVGLERLLVSAARFPSVTFSGVDPVLLGPTTAEGKVLYDQEFVAHTERVITAVGQSGGVILGRAGALVLADHPTALHVRSTGPGSGGSGKRSHCARRHGSKHSTGEKRTPDRGVPLHCATSTPTTGRAAPMSGASIGPTLLTPSTTRWSWTRR